MSKSLRELAQIHYGKSPNSVRVAESAYPIFGTSGQIGYAKEPLFDGPLVVVARKGTLDRPVYTDNSCWVIDTAYAVVSHADVDTKWLYYNLINFDLTVLNEATGVPSISRDYLYRVSFESIEFSKQKKISKILTQIDQLISDTEAVIAKYKAVKQGMMHDLFTRGVDASGKLRPAFEDAPELYKESVIGWIPKEWNIKTTLELSSPLPGSTTIGPFGSNLVASDYRGNGIPVVFVRDIKLDGFEWKSNIFVTPEKAGALSSHLVKPGDILATKMGLPPCVACLYPDWMPEGVITADIIRLRPDLEQVDINWLADALNYDSVQRQVQAITAGVTRPKVTLADFRTLQVACPQIGEQRAISKRLRQISTSLTDEQKQLVKLQKLKNGLMQDLLTGKVRVKTDPVEAVPAPT